MATGAQETLAEAKKKTKWQGAGQKTGLQKNKTEEQINFCLAGGKKKTSSKTIGGPTQGAKTSKREAIKRQQKR